MDRLERLIQRLHAVALTTGMLAQRALGYGVSPLVCQAL